ncbi:glycosyltransferase [Adlercreutzia caecimuris]|uniref:glycosyltransferase n=1 Tax=Adlercreutzia caecimuris TaxID=671266 RepID=UPI001C3E762C
MPRVSFIVPCFNEESNIEDFYQDFASCFSSSPFSWELIFVDDGSTDDTWATLSKLTEPPPRSPRRTYYRPALLSQLW